MSNQNTDTTDDSDDFEPISKFPRPKQMVGPDTEWDGNFSGLTSIGPRFASGVGSTNYIRISRASSSGDYERLSPDDARQMARELRELDERNSALLNYFTGGYRDDPQEMADALEDAADAITMAVTLDDEWMDRLRRTMWDYHSDSDE